MNKGKTVPAVLLALVLAAATCLAGCNNKHQTSNAEATKTNTKKDEVTLELVSNHNAVAVPDDKDNFLAKELKKKLGINIKFVILGAGTDYTTALNTRITGGDVPDMFKVQGKDAINQYADNGTVLDLIKYKDKLKSVIDYSGGEETVSHHLYKDGLYLVPSKRGKSFACWMIRKDWLDNLGLGIPKTPEEFEKVAKAFTDNDPDKNGKNDTYGYSAVGTNGFSAIMNAYGTTISNDFVIKDKKVTSTLLLPQTKEALETCKKWTDAGVVDPDMVSNTYDGLSDKVIQGKVGMITNGWDIVFKNIWMKQILEVNPQAKWICMDAPSTEYVSEPTISLDDVDAQSGNWAVSAEVKKNPEKLKAVIKLLNYLASDEGSRLIFYGLEGRHYNVENNKIIATDLMGKECDWLVGFQILWRDEKEYCQTKFPEASNQIEFAITRKKITCYDAAVDPPENFHSEDFNKYIEDNMLKFIFGQRKISEYAQFIKELDSNFQFKDYLKGGAKQIEQKGYLDVQ